jgi:hypothetical protein
MNVAPPSPPPPPPAIDAVAEPVASTAPKAIVARMVVEFFITRTPSSRPAARRSDGARSKLETRPFSIAELAFGILPSCRVAMELPPTVLDPPGFEMGIWPANDNWRCPEEGIWILRRLSYRLSNGRWSNLDCDQCAAPEPLGAAPRGVA